MVIVVSMVIVVIMVIVVFVVIVIILDLNDGQDPKHTLFCRKNAFVAIYAFYQTTDDPFFTSLGGGSPKMENVTFFTVFFTWGLPLISISMIWAKTNICTNRRDEHHKEPGIFHEHQLGLGSC